MSESEGSGMRCAMIGSGNASSAGFTVSRPEASSAKHRDSGTQWLSSTPADAWPTGKDSEEEGELGKRRRRRRRHEDAGEEEGGLAAKDAGEEELSLQPQFGQFDLDLDLAKGLAWTWTLRKVLPGPGPTTRSSQNITGARSSSSPSTSAVSALLRLRIHAMPF